MKWIEIKMRELGVSTHDGYKVTAFLDSTAMVTVHSAERGIPPSQNFHHAQDMPRASAAQRSPARECMALSIPGIQI